MLWAAISRNKTALMRIVSRQKLQKGRGILQNQAAETPETKKPKKRHGCLTAWLILNIAFSIIFIILYIVGAGVSELPGGSPGWAIPVLIILLIFEIVCAVALFSWKKWGFWGFCVINVVGLIVDIFLGISLLWPCISILVSIVILYGVLNIGKKEDKGWPQLD
jgi:hypothetical protein